MARADIIEAIRRAAVEQGIDPSTALAIAQRESGFNPRAHASKTIYGTYQMTAPLRQQYGIGDSDDPYAQASGWGRFFNDTKAQMSRSLGRDVTDAEAYAGHHFGAGRAAKMFQMDPSTPVDRVFSPYELSLNPHIGRAGTVGNLLDETTGDIDFRRQNFGAEAPKLDFANFDDVGSSTQPKASTATASLNFGQFEPVS